MLSIACFLRHPHWSSQRINHFAASYPSLQCSLYSILGVFVNVCTDKESDRKGKSNVCYPQNGRELTSGGSRAQISRELRKCNWKMNFNESMKKIYKKYRKISNTEKPQTLWYKPAIRLVRPAQNISNCSSTNVKSITIVVSIHRSLWSIQIRNCFRRALEKWLLKKREEILGYSDDCWEKYDVVKKAPVRKIKTQKAVQVKTGSMRTVYEHVHFPASKHVPTWSTAASSLEIAAPAQRLYSNSIAEENIRKFESHEKTV